MFLPKRLWAVAAAAIGLLAALPGATSAKQRRPPRPNLVVSSISRAPSTSGGTGKLTVRVEVKNGGKATASKSSVGLYLATGLTLTKKDLRLARKTVKKLEPRKGAKITINATLPAVTATSVKARSYRLIVCADDTRKVTESSEKDNCRASSAIVLTAPAIPKPPAPPPLPLPPPLLPLPPLLPATPAFTLSDGIDWAFVQDAVRHEPKAGEPVIATLTAANGEPGQAGYTRTATVPQPLVTGSTTTLDYTGTNNNLDDGAAAATLPFPFPFGGVNETSVSVSTNGWISFGSPAWDYWDDTQTRDYRGLNAVIGQFYRGIMPYMGDLDLGDQGAGTGTVSMVVPAGGGSVAFQWDLGQHPNKGVPRRTFQLVLYPDGRFRFDYPGTNAEGGSKAFVGYSLGTGTGSLDTVSTEGTAVPPTSVMFTPNSAASVSSLAAGAATLSLPAGSSLVSADSGCALTTTPGSLTPGLVTCAMPAIAAGEQLTRTVTFASPLNAPGQVSPANFGLAAVYRPGSFTLNDETELDTLGNNLRSTTVNLAPTYTSPPTPKSGVQSTFTVQVKPVSGNLDQPTATFTLPANTTLSSIKIGVGDLDCDPPAAGVVQCRLPSGIGLASVLVSVTPSAAAVGSPMTLGSAIRSLNAPVATASVSSPSVVP